MQESWKFDIIELSDKKPYDYNEIIERLFEKKGKDLGIFLSYYYKSEGGLVEDVRLQDGVEFIKSTSGTVKVNFNIIYYNACLDINSDNNRQEMTLNFELIPSEQKIKLIGPYWPEREPDEI